MQFYLIVGGWGSAWFRMAAIMARLLHVTVRCLRDNWKLGTLILSSMMYPLVKVSVCFADVDVSRVFESVCVCFSFRVVMYFILTGSRILFHTSNHTFLILLPYLVQYPDSYQYNIFSYSGEFGPK